MTLTPNFLPVGSIVEYNGMINDIVGIIPPKPDKSKRFNNVWAVELSIGVICPLSDIEPVPLTPEILTEWCGFEPAVDSFGGLLSPEFNRGRIRIHDNKWYNGIEYIQLDYLHELQLLFLGMKQVLTVTIK